VTVVEIGSPSPEGTVVILNSNATYTIQTCFTPTLSFSSTNWNLYINGVLQPPASYIFRPVGSVAGCPGMRSFLYFWVAPVSGSNVIQVVYTNGITLSDTRTVAAGTNPYDPNSFLRITDLVSGNPVELVWSSVPNKSYQVLATTNLFYPMAPVAGAVVSADPSNAVTRWFDGAPDATNRYYRIQVLP
jgi:hypothetical protein